MPSLDLHGHKACSYQNKSNSNNNKNGQKSQGKGQRCSRKNLHLKIICIWLHGLQIPFFLVAFHLWSPLPLIWVGQSPGISLPRSAIGAPASLIYLLIYSLVCVDNVLFKRMPCAFRTSVWPLPLQHSSRLATQSSLPFGFQANIPAAPLCLCSYTLLP